MREFRLREVNGLIIFYQIVTDAALIDSKRSTDYIVQDFLCSPSVVQNFCIYLGCEKSYISCNVSVDK